MTFIEDPLNFYPDFDPNVEPRILAWIEELIPPQNIYRMTYVPNQDEMKEKEINENDYDIFSAPSVFHKAAAPKLYIPKETKNNLNK